MPVPRVGVVCDLLEENWPSMDLVADMLLTHLQSEYADLLDATRIRPPMRRRFTRQTSEVRGQISAYGSKLFNADRVLNRFWDYPRFVRGLKSEFDLFHVIDHSYGQLVHQLPPERTVITCHDLDTFQCLLNPAQEPRSIFFRKMMSRTLNGLRQAARVTCVSNATRDELLAQGLIEPERLVVIANGVHPSCSVEEDRAADAEAERLTGKGQRAMSNGIEILHVGSTIPRKRIDILLRVFARVKDLFPSARLLRVGGTFTAEQTTLLEKLGLRGSVLVFHHLDRDVLAAVYRRATLVLQPSEREGFGLPIVEAMACGTPVVASDLPVLREVGGEAVEYCRVGQVEEWTERIADLLEERKNDAAAWEKRREAGLRQASKFTWPEYTRKMVETYAAVLRGLA